MELDRERLRRILEAEHSYYGSAAANYRNDDRLNPGARDLIASQFCPGMRVLDIGCGNGVTLLENCHRFSSGLGIDNDPEHIHLAEDALRESDATNVEFRLLDFLEDAEELKPESFDFVFTQRGPVGYNSFGIQAALSLLNTGGLLFCEVIGDLHHQEVRELFGTGPRLNQMISTLDQVRVAMERNGVGIRIAADIVSKRYYPDIYEWLQFQCGIWAWSGGSLPDPDDVRLGLFAERNTIQTGEIETTHHVTWVGGVKLEDGPPYWKFEHFAK